MWHFFLNIFFLCVTLSGCQNVENCIREGYSLEAEGLID